MCQQQHPLLAAATAVRVQFETRRRHVECSRQHALAYRNFSRRDASPPKLSHFDYYPENARKQYKSGSVEPAQCPGQCARDGRADRRVVIKFAQFAVWSRRRLRY